MFRTLTFPSRSLAVLFGLLLLAVLLPTLLMLWTLNRALRNDESAVREELMRTYRERLESAVRKYEVAQRTRVWGRDAVDETDPYAVYCDVLDRSQEEVLAVALFDKNNEPIFPTDQYAPQVIEYPESWFRAPLAKDDEERLTLYREAVAGATDLNARGVALAAELRLLLRQERWIEAAELALQWEKDSALLDAEDELGRRVSTAAFMDAWEALPENLNVRAVLRKSIDDDLGSCPSASMPSPQRRHLLARWDALRQADERQKELLKFEERSVLLAENRKDEIWKDQPAGRANAVTSTRMMPWGVVMMLLDVEALRHRVKKGIGDIGIPYSVELPNQPATFDGIAVKLDLKTLEGGWYVMIPASEITGISELTRERRRMTIWIAVLGVALSSFAAFLVAWVIQRQHQLARVKNDLIATVAHELKTPLASTRLLLETLQNEEGMEEQQRREYVDLLAGENARLIALVQNFLSWSRMERRRPALRMAESDPRHLVDLALEAVGERIRAVTLVESGDELPFLRCDEEAMVTVLTNLLENAWKYTGDEKAIVIGCHALEGKIVFEVRDNGPGIPAPLRQRVFQPYYQMDRTLSGHVGGTGLGLSIVRFLLEAHNGRIDIEDNQPEGCLVRISLPLPPRQDI